MQDGTSDGEHCKGEEWSKLKDSTCEITKVELAVNKFGLEREWAQFFKGLSFWNSTLIKIIGMMGFKMELSND